MLIFSVFLLLAVQKHLIPLSVWPIVTNFSHTASHVWLWWSSAAHLNTDFETVKFYALVGFCFKMDVHEVGRWLWVGAWRRENLREAEGAVGWSGAKYIVYRHDIPKEWIKIYFKRKGCSRINFQGMWRQYLCLGLSWTHWSCFPEVEGSVLVNKSDIIVFTDSQIMLWTLEICFYYIIKYFKFFPLISKIIFYLYFSPSKLSHICSFLSFECMASFLH